MKHLLIVDDDYAQLISLKLLLKHSPLKGKIKVTTAQSFDDAVRVLAKGGVDTVLCDVNIDMHYGPDLKKLHKKVPFVYVTGDHDWKSPDGSTVLPKPYNHDKLYDTLRQHLRLVESLDPPLSENIFTLTRLIAAQDITVVDAIKNLLEVAPPGWSGTVKKMKGKSKISNPFALSWWMHNRGDRPHYKPEEGKPKYRRPAKLKQ